MPTAEKLVIINVQHHCGGQKAKPQTIIFMNNGAKLVIKDSLVLGELCHLEKEWVETLACGMCLSRL
jgi:intracellular sulfur oxidation DsrE/DsrF family protein